MVVTDRPTGGFPDVFLRIELRSGNGEVDNLQARVGLQHVADGLTTMPGCPIPQEEDRFAGDRVQDLPEVLGRRFGIHDSGSHYDLLAGMQVERAVEVDLLTPRVRPDHRRVSLWSPYSHRRRLQILASLILGQDHRLRRILSHIDQFFSSCSSNSATLTAERDL
jgi:hypothetical protein